jgi:hypothetical protein
MFFCMHGNHGVKIIEPPETPRKPDLPPRRQDAKTPRKPEYFSWRLGGS